MNDTPHFEPIFPSHAVERCGASIIYAQDMPGKAFQKISTAAATIFRDAGFEALQNATGVVSHVSIQVDAQGRVSPLSGPAPALYTSPDKGTQFIASANSITVRTGRYVRWEPFIGQFEELLLPLHQIYSDVVTVQSLQLDYSDRFLWTGSWEDFDWKLLLRDDAQFVAGRAASVQGPWHSHSGWFESGARSRRLVNVNIDLSEVINPASGLNAPSVAILTLLRDDMTVPEDPIYTDGASVQSGLEQLHNELKTLFEQIITVPMAQRIGLRQRGTDATRSN
jgi:uncharacterized protein (TIGR04255 family)